MTSKTDYDYYKQFTTITHSGRSLLKMHSLEEEGTWKVHGEDPNCDMGGHHSKPYLGMFEGKLEDVIRTVVALPEFWAWGSGGSITKVTVRGVTKYTATEQDKLRDRVEELRAELKDLEGKLINGQN